MTHVRAAGAFLITVTLVAALQMASPSGPASASAPERQAYSLVASDGGVFAYGGAGHFGSTGASRLTRPVVGMASTPSGNGYWLVGSDGGIFAFGDARFFGSTGALRLTQPIVGMASTSTGNGYWLVASDGGIFAFGDAPFFGSTGALRLNRPIVGMAASPSGNGYRLVASDGGIFAFGDARFFGSTGAVRLNRPIVGMASSATGNGYWLAASDGGIFAFGDAQFSGSTGALSLVQPIVGMAASSTGNGYWLVASDGGIFAFGAAAYLGSAGSLRLAHPVVGMAATKAIGPAGTVGGAGSGVGCGLGSFGAGRWPSACWRPYGDASPFNRRVPAAPRVLANSAAMVSRVLGMGPIADIMVAPDTTSDWSHPVYYPGPNDPLYTIHCTRTWGRCEVEGMQVRIPAAARAAGGGDGHLTVVDQASGWEYDFWQVQDKPSGGGTITISWGGRTEISGDGLGSDATAAHFGLLAGIIRAQEMEAGRIDHALFMVVGCTAKAHVYPAQGNAAACGDQTNAPPDGQYFWLDMSDAEIDALGVPAWKKTILRALAHYGAFVGDTGGNEAFALQFESGSSYTSFGVADPMADFARKQTSGVRGSNGKYSFDLASGVDWRGRLRALDPCVARAAC